MSVCLPAIISSEPHAVARSLWRCNGMLCTSGFMDDVTIARKLRARRRRPVEAQRTRSLGLGYKLCAVTKVAGLRTHGTTRGRSLRSVTALLILHGRHVVPRGLSSSWGSRLAKFHPPPVHECGHGTQKRSMFRTCALDVGRFIPP